jgi:hypothetical protein
MKQDCCQVPCQRKKKVVNIKTFSLRIRVLVDEPYIHALFKKLKLVLHNIGRGPINREVVTTLTTFHAKICMATWCEYALNGSPATS